MVYFEEEWLKNRGVETSIDDEVVKLTLLSGFRSFNIIIQYWMSKSLKKSKQVVKEIQTCPICMTRSINCKTVECQHEFCYRCLSKWGRRKGNCPLCRTNVRKIHYKKKLIQPDYLKLFDEQSSIQISSDPETPRSTPHLLPPPMYVRNFAIFLPLAGQIPTLNYFHPLTYLMFPHDNA